LKILWGEGWCRNRAGSGPMPVFPVRVQTQAFVDLPGFFLDYRPRSINQTWNPGAGLGFSKNSITSLVQFISS